ncbi:MAG: hypothetical protein AVDCRST_MAG93-9073 [uncultured Chloroflexia bacterium]|uniref:PDZ domain-containing protein n=1 Tax=uncultured Chloroflexia bacterium TaxID=1672391 RepID=A0A6J4N752_9CHLR|nr:MAG: hypothetical protein AVDCRST_MAG93-9073 [uncultured Chloroflexia bacterium]
MNTLFIRRFAAVALMTMTLAACDAGQQTDTGEAAPTSGQASAPTTAGAEATPVAPAATAEAEATPVAAAPTAEQTPLRLTSAENSAQTTATGTDTETTGAASEATSPAGGSDASAAQAPNTVQTTGPAVQEDAQPAQLGLEQVIGAVNDRAGPAVVRISTGQGLGSGFLIDTEGHIVTNNHVIANAPNGEVLVSFSGLFDTLGRVVGTDPDSDTAVIKVDEFPEGVQPVELGDSATLRIGQTTIAIGNPLGQERTVTNGIVSALGRTISEEQSNYAIGGAVQTDAAINPGNSGGPLLDSSARVIGMNTAILSQSGTSSGVGFAVPVNLIKKVVPALIEDGSYEHPWLGVQMGEVSTFTARQENLPSAGILMAPSGDGSPAAAAGITNEVIVTAINGNEMTSTEDVIAYLELNTAPGDTVTLNVVDQDGTRRDVQVTLGSRPSVADRQAQEQAPVP